MSLPWGTSKTALTGQPPVSHQEWRSELPLPLGAFGAFSSDLWLTAAQEASLLPLRRTVSSHPWAPFENLSLLVPLAQRKGFSTLPEPESGSVCRWPSLPSLKSWGLALNQLLRAVRPLDLKLRIPWGKNHALLKPFLSFFYL